MKIGTNNWKYFYFIVIILRLTLIERELQRIELIQVQYAEVLTFLAFEAS